MKDPFINNLRAKSIINAKIIQANKYKYNFSINREAEELSGESNDREAMDVDGQYQPGELIKFN